MPHNDNINHNGPGLDELLRQSLLDLDENNPAHRQLLDDVAEGVFSREWPAPSNKEKEAQLLHAGKKSSSPKWVWILSSLILVSGVIALAMTRKNIELVAKEVQLSETQRQQKEKPDSFKIKQTTVAEKNTGQETKEFAKHASTATKPFAHHPAKKTTSEKDNALAPVTDTEATVPVFPALKDSAAQQKPEVKEEKSNLPVLSDFEINEHLKKKALLISRWKQLKLDDYTHIHVQSSGKMSFNDFYLKRGEVSNADYDLFLKDLILQKRADEYGLAKPGYEEWIGKMNNPNVKNFIKDYFTCDQYANYPVVCVSPEAAKLYCEWLEAEITGAGISSALNIEVRLPYDDEWRFAACPAKKKYGTENGKLKSWLSGYKANFIGTQVNPEALVSNSTEFMNPAGDLSGDHFRKVKMNFTTTAMAYMMNNFGLFNMSGNVSEMVLYRRPDKNAVMRTIGGNWHSEKQFLEINAKDEFNNKVQASPFVGFRPEIIITAKTNSDK